MVYLPRLMRWLRTGLVDEPRRFKAKLETRLQNRRYLLTNHEQILQRDPAREDIRTADAVRKADPAEALRRLTALAEAGSVWSAHLVGYAYWAGEGVAADTQQADHWFRRAYEGGCQQSELRLADIYMRRGDLARCDEILGPDAAAGWPPAMFYLGLSKLQRPRTRERLAGARYWLERAAAAGDFDADVMLARAMVRGWFGLWRIPAGVARLARVATAMSAMADREADAAS